MQLAPPDPNSVPPAPPEGMRWVWHAAGAEWVLDSELPERKRTFRERLRPTWGLHQEPTNRTAWVLTGAGVLVSGPAMLIGLALTAGALIWLMTALRGFGIG